MLDKCMISCTPLSGDEARHNKDCPHYKESLSKMLDDAQLELATTKQTLMRLALSLGVPVKDLAERGAERVMGMKARDKVAQRLVYLYQRDDARVAKICDEHLDKTGNLLGYLRDAAALTKPQEAEDEQP